MEARRLGASGLLVSALGLGTNNLGSRLDPAASQAVVEAALDLGVRFIDTADIYVRAGAGPLGSDLAFAWRLSQPIVGPVIASASTPEQVRHNAKSAEWRLTEDELAALAEG